MTIIKSKFDADMAVIRKINLKKLKYSFKCKPLLVGGLAMEYYNLRASGSDIDLIVSRVDHKALIKKYKTKKDRWKKVNNSPKYKNFPEFVNLYGDRGILLYEFEIWDRIGYDYNFLSKGAIEEKDILVIALDELLIMKALAMRKKKYLNDLKLIVKELSNRLY